MYNRYVRNEDGVYVKTIVEDPVINRPFIEPVIQDVRYEPVPEPKPEPEIHAPFIRQENRYEKRGGLKSMLGRLMPAGMDTGDLLLILMLILILLDSEEDEMVILIAIAMFLLF